jgi:hypothetical protein
MRLRSSVCSTEVMVIQAPDGDVDVTCGGAALVPLGTPAATGGALDPAAAGGTKIGKRYTDAAGELELLCTRAGDGALALAGMPLVIKGAKPLPSSD